ncbi:condensation domain-containing protein [Mucilaginibacter sabulilitoris]|uniref:Condensation domain-containing protein n=1 Tax=Mucilaginibacter sabulilitoris TaxID=1173583 RepID=A0ABZ0TF59_9SPHI|nr:condensation domain-containing protein [Mucilaginibacter sabulilitoris]WPU91404.1 condensation domain-containing protein [Mucilaginibacter sabulilitoris]
MKRKLLFAERVIYGDGKKAFNAVVPIKIHGSFSEADLNFALSRIQEKHPLLKAFIEVDKYNMPWFVVDEAADNPIPVRTMARISDDDWETEVTNEWSTSFNTGKGPLMRVIWIKGEHASDLILVMHHCLCDGRTAMSILADLLKVLNNSQTDIGKQAPILSMYDIVPAEVLENKKRIIKAKLKGLLNHFLLWIIPVNRKLPKRGKDYMIHWKLDKDLGNQLVLTSKSAGVTINTLLCVVILKAFQEIRKEKFFNNIACPVDIRKYMPLIKEDCIFAFVSMVALAADNKLNFIDNAKKMQEVINTKIAKLDPYQMIMMFEESHSSINYLIDFLRYSKPDNDFLFSNLGRIGIEHQYRSFEVETIYSPSAVGPFGNTTGFVASTYRGLMDFTFIGNELFIPYDEALLIKERIVDIIQEQTAHLTPATAV